MTFLRSEISILEIGLLNIYNKIENLIPISKTEIGISDRMTLPPPKKKTNIKTDILSKWLYPTALYTDSLLKQNSIFLIYVKSTTSISISMRAIASYKDCRDKLSSHTD
jgi:hypothetical protein